MSQPARRTLTEDAAEANAIRTIEERMQRTLDEGERHTLACALRNAELLYIRTATPSAEMQERLNVMASSAEKLMQGISIILNERGLTTMLERMEEDKVDWRFTDFQQTYETLHTLKEELPKMALWIRPRAKRTIKTGRPENDGNLPVLVFYVAGIWKKLFGERWDDHTYKPKKGPGNASAFVECVRVFLDYATRKQFRPAPHTQLATTVRKALREIQKLGAV